MIEPIDFPVPPVIKRVRVRLTPEQAFRRFTEDINSWWPLAAFSISRSTDAACFIEGHIGGRIFELDAAGVEHVWGKVELWSPPTELRLRWHPARSESEAQDLHLRFELSSVNTTLVTLVHSGWESLTAGVAEVRASYDRGWEAVLLHRFAGSYRVGVGDAK